MRRYNRRKEREVLRDELKDEYWPWCYWFFVDWERQTDWTQERMERLARMWAEDAGLLPCND